MLASWLVPILTLSLVHILGVKPITFTHEESETAEEFWPEPVYASLSAMVAAQTCGLLSFLAWFPLLQGKVEANLLHTSM